MHTFLNLLERIFSVFRCYCKWYFKILFSNCLLLVYSNVIGFYILIWVNSLINSNNYFVYFSEFSKQKFIWASNKDSFNYFSVFIMFYCFNAPLYFLGTTNKMWKKRFRALSPIPHGKHSNYMIKYSVGCRFIYVLPLLDWRNFFLFFSLLIVFMKSVEFCLFSASVNLIIWSSLNVWIILLDFWRLDKYCISGRNPTRSQCWIQFSNI